MADRTGDVQREDVQALRVRIARALWDFALFPETFPEDGEEREAALASADAVLEELRLSRVGTVSPDVEGFPRFSGVTPSTEDFCYERECPVYRLDTPSWDRSALVHIGRQLQGGDPS